MGGTEIMLMSRSKAKGSCQSMKRGAVKLLIKAQERDDVIFF